MAPRMQRPAALPIHPDLAALTYIQGCPDLVEPESQNTDTASSTSLQPS